MLGFNGEQYEARSRTYVLGQGYRCYSPALQRFQAPDDRSPFSEGGLNAYAYCVNDPINYLDDTGQSPSAALLRKGKAQLKAVSQTRYQKVSNANQPPQQRVANAVKTSQKKKNVSFATDTIFKNERHGRYHERTMLTSRLERLHSLYEIVNSDIQHLWATTTRLNYKNHNLIYAYLRRLSSLNTTVKQVQNEKERIQKRLQEIRW